VGADSGHAENVCDAIEALAIASRLFHVPKHETTEGRPLDRVDPGNQGIPLTAEYGYFK
jgi:hypothetical protein